MRWPGARMVTPQLLSRPTPCVGWDLETLLDHVSDSIEVLHEVIATAGADAGAAPLGHPGLEPDPAVRLRGQAARLLGACAAAGPAERRGGPRGPPPVPRTGPRPPPPPVAPLRRAQAVP